MDSESLEYTFDFPVGSGHTLTVEEKTALSTSLVILKKNYKFNRVLFWGKILGIQMDYFIAQGRGEDEMKGQKYLYSFDCMDWYLLPPVTESMIKKVSKAAKGRFVGDPAHVYMHVETEKKGGDKKSTGKKVVTKVSEENRLTVTVNQIDQEVSVVPKGSFIKTHHGLTYVNSRFKGLSVSEASNLENFFHFTQQKNSKKLSTPGKQDFMDRLSDDVPKGSWHLRFEHTNTVCVIRSHLWLGLTFYHVPMTPKHGYVYIGDGLRNVDLPFLL